MHKFGDLGIGENTLSNPNRVSIEGGAPKKSPTTFDVIIIYSFAVFGNMSTTLYFWASGPVLPKYLSPYRGWGSDQFHPQIHRG